MKWQTQRVHFCRTRTDDIEMRDSDNGLRAERTEIENEKAETVNN